MARRDDGMSVWPLGMAVACLALAVGSPVLFRGAWDSGFALAALSLVVGLVFFFVGRVGRAPAPADQALRAGATLWWPFVVGMAFFGIAVTAPFGYRLYPAAGLLVATLASVGAIGMLYLGKLLMRARRR